MTKTGQLNLLEIVERDHLKQRKEKLGNRARTMKPLSLEEFLVSNPPPSLNLQVQHGSKMPLNIYYTLSRRGI